MANYNKVATKYNESLSYWRLSSIKSEIVESEADVEKKDQVSYDHLKKAYDELNTECKHLRQKAYKLNKK